MVDTGAVLGDVTGVVSYSFGNFEILPTIDFTANITPSTLQPEATELVGSQNQLTIANYNVLNLDPNDADGDTDVADGRFEAIALQIINNLNSPDVIGLQEVQDNSGSTDDGTVAADATLQLLVDAIVAAGGPTYEFIDNIFIRNNANGGQPGGNIRTAYLYNPDRVNLVENSVQPVGNQEPGSPFNGSRLPLAATFEFNGEEVSVINNHFSSKGGSAPIFGVEQDFDARQEEPVVNGSLDERRLQAQAVNNFVDDVLANDTDANVVVLGDLNEFEFISPLDILAGTTVTSADGLTISDSGEPAVLNNLINTIPEDERYSFIFQGNSQELDHVLVSNGLVSGAQIDTVHVNSEFAESDTRASAHDPVVVSLTIELLPKNQFLKGTFRNDKLEGGRGNDTVKGGFGKDTVYGAEGDDLLKGGFGADVLNGDEGDDTLKGGFGPDILDGGEGDDTVKGGFGQDIAVLSGNREDFTFTGSAGNFTATGSETGTDKLMSIEFVQFDNGLFPTAALDFV